VSRPLPVDVIEGARCDLRLMLGPIATGCALVGVAIPLLSLLMCL
jgi:hypothetical protein